jgi:hypothetical protein
MLQEVDGGKSIHEVNQENNLSEATCHPSNEPSSIASMGS